MWDYAELSHEAKEHGGPEQYIQDIEQNSYAQGQQDAYKNAGVVGMIVGGAAAVVVGICAEIFGEWRQKRKQAREAAAAAKEILIQEMKQAESAASADTEETMIEEPSKEERQETQPAADAAEAEWTEESSEKEPPAAKQAAADAGTSAKSGHEGESP